MIRVGVLLDGPLQPRWVASILEELNDCSFASVVLSIYNAASGEPIRTRRQRRVRHGQLLYRIYRKLDDRLARSSDDPFELVDVTNTLVGAKELQARPKRTRYSDYFEEDDVRTIREHRLDVGLRFGFRILRGAILDVATHGIWSYHHGDNRRYRGGPPGFWEVMNGDSCFGTVLQVLSEDLDGGQVLYRSTAATHPHSVYKSRAAAYWKTASFVRRALVMLHRNGRLPSECPSASPYSKPLYKAPRNLEMARLLVRHGYRAFTNHFRAATSDYRWHLSYAFEDRIGETPLYRFRRIEAPADRFWADPHVVRTQDAHFVLFEEYVYRQKKGRIAALRMDGDGSWKYLGPVLEQDYHLSYPFVFQWEGRHYMIPETAQRRCVELYRSDSFPYEWKKESILLEDIAAADTTIAAVGDLYWLFASVGVHGASKDDELCLFHAKSPLGPWVPHPLNPVKSDVRSCRPAGPLYRIGERLYRPSQDCSVRYGYAITLNQVTKLTVDEYSEHEVGRIEPDWADDLLGVHSLSHADGLTFIDALGVRSKLSWSLQGLSERFSPAVS